MNVDNEFTVAAPIERAWTVLTDLEGIAPCLPGAVLTGRDGDTYSGKVKVRVGPVTSEYVGTASFAELDPASHRAVIDARGRDSRGAGNANALITAQLAPEGDGTTVTVSTDLRISGKIAQFGSGVIQDVSKKLLGEFVTCLEAKLAADETSSAATETTSPTPSTPSTPMASSAVDEPAVVEPEAVDLVALSRSAVAKRAVPMALGAAAVAVIVYLVAR